MQRSRYKHIAIGSKVEGDTVIKIKKPTNEEAYSRTWTGAVRFQNPKWYDIYLSDGRVVKDRDLHQIITPEGEISLGVVQ
jgi:hypothetical protein